MTERHPDEILHAELNDRFAKVDLAGVIAMCDKSMAYMVTGSAVPTGGIYDNN